MRKLTIFTGTLLHGGSERVISNLCEKFVKEYDEVEIILFHNKPIWYKINENVKITIIDRELNGNKNIISKAIWLRKYIMNNNTSIVLSFLAPFNMFAIICLLKSKIPIIVAERNDPNYIPNKIYLRGLRNILYNFADRIIVQTDNNKSYFSNHLSNKIDVIYNPIFIEDKYMGKALKCDKKQKIVSVGRLVKQKNQRMLIDAFKIINKKYPNYELVIYGEGELRYELNNQIDEYNLNKHIKLAGAKQDILDNIVNSEIFVLTSNFEGMPNALIEAMCLGLPCISTKVSGAVDLIINNENGILIERGNHIELAKEIDKLIEHKEHAKRLAYNASLISKELDINKISSQWIDSIENVLKKFYI